MRQENSSYGVVNAELIMMNDKVVKYYVPLIMFNISVIYKNFSIFLAVL